MIRRQFQDPPEIMSMAMNFDSARRIIEEVAFSFSLNSSGRFAEMLYINDYLSMFCSDGRVRGLPPGALQPD
jgi:hypothetical protein